MESLPERDTGLGDFLGAKSSTDGQFRDGELLDKLIQNIPVMIVIWDPNIQVLRFNREFQRVLGWTEADAARPDFMERLYPDPEYRAEVAAYMASLESGWRDFEVIAKNGEKVLSTWANILLSDHRRVGIGIDIRQRRQLAEAFRTRRAEVQLVADAIPVLISHVGADLRYCFVNAAYEHWFGIAQDEAVGLRVEEVVGTEAYEVIRPHAEAALSGRTARFYALPLSIDERFEGAVAVSVDITKLRAVEEDLRELNVNLERRVAERTADLEARNKELQQFAFIASHDLREPLRKIQAFGDLLKDEVALSEETSEFFIERIQSCAKRMDDLLDDLLTFSRVAMRTRPFLPIRIADIVDEACSDLMLTIGEADADVDVAADAFVEADAGQLRQLIHHLVGNAVKFRRDGIRPRVRVQAAIEGKDGEEICRITVEDNGIGFDPKYAERIFEPFERLHERGAFEGTGMGLAICKRIVQLHRGSIAAESTLGKGSRFIVKLPARTIAELPEA